MTQSFVLQLRHVFETKSLIEVNKKSESSSEESTSSNYVQFFEFYFIM
jgi:hypothetical protein